ncbi:hypothetical protein LWI28_001887 [Acer negundo]|uniref:Uncharacterized protein n=1 Tax=Acer negundo TaxID=4023 RepID=A0AAD5NR74_ACENE|nr:hypothetical protein LWI28_001887 [Acer negundo]
MSSSETKYQFVAKSFILRPNFNSSPNIWLCESFEFQLEDNVWDDFGGSDDHIVLHLCGEYKEQLVIWGYQKVT